MASSVDTDIKALQGVSGMVLVTVLAFLAATKRRAGVSITRGGLVLPVLVSSGLIVAAYVGIGFAVDAATGPEHDFVAEEELWALVAAAIVTHIVMYTTLSMARR